MKERNLRIELVLTRAGARWGLVAFILALGTAPLVSESLTLSTYYPSPLGVYKQLVTTGTGSTNTLLARDSGSVGIGTTSPSSKLNVAGDVNVDPGTASGNVNMSGSASQVNLNGLGGTSINLKGAGSAINMTGSNNALNVTGTGATIKLGTGNQTITVDNNNMFMLNSAAPALGLYANGAFQGALQAGGGAVSVTGLAGTPFSGNASSTTVNFGGSPILYGDGTNTQVFLNGSAVLQAQTSCGGSVACTGLGVSGAFPLIVYASPRNQVMTTGYFYAGNGSDAGCIEETVPNFTCPLNYYATWTAGFKAYGKSFQPRPSPPNLYGTNYAGGSYLNKVYDVGTYEVDMNWNMTDFLCCPN